ncbi:GNAT family N-acetyltransferase [Blastococcus saxobsidens]|uniref:GNAT family N-acetyltransferase n=1 Tax=Blastococcus saxobsidens TaxID=138336 RepID=A0A6L9VYK0_9ACTN|nr:GNAT family N-acetyltransferase [Blastococcus saxobsidens]NEK84250.1 GNAT family N-acetyltransferase [Blastococcus saxobsidens]
MDVVPDAHWDKVIGEVGPLETYLRCAYHRVSAHAEPPGTRPVLLLHSDGGAEIALPLLLRPLPDGSGWDATSAYGYGGPVGTASRATAAFGEALDRWARENRVVTTFLRLHPLVGNVALVPAGAELVSPGPTVAWDVTPGRDLAAAQHAHHRRAVARARKAGVTVRIVEAPETLDRFRELYEETMRRQRADTFYLFPDAYWAALEAERHELGVVVVEGWLDGEVAAALLCFAGGPWLHYHLGGSSDAGRTVGASHLCFLSAATWAQSRGMSRFHLGGGTAGGAESPLFVFKRRFDPGSEPLAFSVAKLVHDPARHAALAGTDSTAGFFPPWRSPA